MNAHLREALAVLPDYLSQHVLLCLAALALGVSLSLPLAIFAMRTRLLRGAILGLAGLIQTIPGIALLAFMIPLLGIGVWPALVALFLYSLYPILRNTYEGVRGTDAGAVDAGQALGMTPRQVMLYVRLPLATPVTLSLNVTVHCTLVAFVGVAPTRFIEETVGVPRSTTYTCGMASEPRLSWNFSSGSR